MQISSVSHTKNINHLGFGVGDYSTTWIKGKNETYVSPCALNDGVNLVLDRMTGDTFLKSGDNLLIPCVIGHQRDRNPIVDPKFQTFKVSTKRDKELVLQDLGTNALPSSDEAPDGYR